MFTRPHAVEAVLLARFDGGLTWTEIHALFNGTPRPRSTARTFVMSAEDSKLLLWQQAPRRRGVLRGRGRWHLTESGRAFVHASAKGSA